MITVKAIREQQKKSESNRKLARTQRLENKQRFVEEEEEAYYKLNVHTKEITQRAKNGRTVNLSSGLGRPIEMSFSGKLCHIETAPGVKEGDAGFSIWIETKSLLDAIRQATERGEIEGGEK